MSDTERIQKLEKELQRLASLVDQLSRLSERRRASIESAIHGVQNDLEIIYANVNMPGITYTPGKRASIE